MKRKRTLYDELLFQAAAAALPSVVLRVPPDATSGEIVDEAILIARDLLSELGYKYGE